MALGYEYRIPYFATNENLETRYEYILHLFIEASNRHSDERNANIDEALGPEETWMLYKWRVKFIERPKAQTKVYIRTWPSDFGKIRATREFEMVDGDGNVLAYATSIWVLVNYVKGRPMVIPKHFGELFGVEEDARLQFTEFDDFRYDDETELKGTFKVRKSDIDINHHVNNVNYLNWMLEVVDDSELDLDELEIYYVGQTKYGDVIDSETAVLSSDDDGLVILHEIYAHGREEVCTYGKTTWRVK